jgi:hypothetical protein
MAHVCHVYGTCMPCVRHMYAMRMAHVCRVYGTCMPCVWHINGCVCGTCMPCVRVKCNSISYTSKLYDAKLKRANSNVRYDNGNSAGYGQIEYFLKTENDILCTIYVYAECSTFARSTTQSPC